MPHHDERRSFFRVDDEILLHYHVIGAEGQETRSSPGLAPQVATAGILSQIDREFGESINRLWQQQPEVARALGLLNRKLSVISRTMDALHGITPPEFQEARVNISGSGMAFEAGEDLGPGTLLRLQLVLKPSQEELTVRGAVISSERLPDDESADPRWRIRIDFDESLDERERLIQHILQLQSIRISEERQAR